MRQFGFGVSASSGTDAGPFSEGSRMRYRLVEVIGTQLCQRQKLGLLTSSDGLTYTGLHILAMNVSYICTEKGPRELSATIYFATAFCFTSSDIGFSSTRMYLKRIWQVHLNFSAESPDGANA